MPVCKKCPLGSVCRCYVEPVTDKYVELLKQRSETGLKKYGVTLERNDLNMNQWLQHLIEEMLDGANYAQVCKDKLKLNLEAAFKDGFNMGRETNVYEPSLLLYQSDDEAWHNSNTQEAIEENNND